MAHRRPAVVVYHRAGITHTGAKSGTSHAATVVYSTDGGRVIVMALNFGSSRNPVWYYDALKCRCMPTVSAAVSSPKNHRRRTRQALRRGEQVSAPYGPYQKSATCRRIPVIAFSPADSADSTRWGPPR